VIVAIVGCPLPVGQRGAGPEPDRGPWSPVRVRDSHRESKIEVFGWIRGRGDPGRANRV